MIGRLGMAPRIAALTPSEFQHHWRTSHADAVAALPGLRGYVQFHAVLSGGKLQLAYPGFDACSLLLFDSIDSMDAAFVSPQFTSAVHADEQAFVDKCDFSGLLGEWEVDSQVANAEAVLLMELWQDAPDLPEITASLIATPGHHEGRFAVAAPVVTWRNFTSVDEALEAASKSQVQSGLMAQHLCKPVAVVDLVDPHQEGIHLS